MPGTDQLYCPECNGADLGWDVVRMHYGNMYESTETGNRYGEMYDYGEATRDSDEVLCMSCHEVFSIDDLVAGSQETLDDA